MNLSIPNLCVIVLIGPSSSGKTSFAKKHFLPTEVLSSDMCRAWIADDENAQNVTAEAFELLHFVAKKRLDQRRLVVVDATNVQPEARKSLLALARDCDVHAIAMVFNLPEKVLRARHAARSDRNFHASVIASQTRDMRRSLRSLREEGFRFVYVFDSEEEINSVQIERAPLWTDRREDHGPFDIIGDVHGCFEELMSVLRSLGYQVQADQSLPYGYQIQPPDGRRLIFLGDLVDRGPGVLDVLRLAMSAVSSGAALCLPGNHEIKLLRKLRGRAVKLTHGLAETMSQLEGTSDEFRSQLESFLASLVSHYVLDNGRLVVAHAGMKTAYQGRASGRVKEFALYGDTTGETDELGLPVRLDWASEYRGEAMVVYGHTPVSEPAWVNRTINIDTGCVFGGKLSAFRYPEREIVSVPALRTYYEPARPLTPSVSTQEQERIDQGRGELLDIEDVSGKRSITTKLAGRVTIREGNARAALEAMSRFSLGPRWLIYLPPTMSPVETSSEPDFLEEPAAAFNYYRESGCQKVTCQQKHMGSRAVVIVCQDESAAKRRFGSSRTGVIYSRTGRAFFNDPNREAQVLERVRSAMDKSGLWQDLETDWVCLDCELMPWSTKALDLLKNQYAPVGASARAAITETLHVLRQAKERSSDMQPLLERWERRQKDIDKYVKAYQQYCWPVRSTDDLRLAPFHVLASEGKAHCQQDHGWHLAKIEKLVASDESGFLQMTPHQIVQLDQPESEAKACAWWHEMTGSGAEGMVVKPWTFVTQGKKGLVQPALKVRGPEYLRIIYGPEYRAKENLDRLRARALSSKRSLAKREFALGVESLERFVAKEPLYRVHECVFAVLALESEPVDPRL